MSDHPALKTLPLPLRTTLIRWIQELIENIPTEFRNRGVTTVSWVVDELWNRIYPEEEAPLLLPVEELFPIQEWDRTLDDDAIYHIVGSFYSEKVIRDAMRIQTPTPARPATERQLQIIRELQEEEPDIDFSPCFSALSTWAAHSVIQGLLVLSEVTRCTGRRELRPGDLRRAVREFLQRARATGYTRDKGV